MFYKKKEKKGKLFFCCFYGFFLTINAIIKPTTMIAMNRPAIAGMKYRSAIDGAGVGSGVAVAGASRTVKDVSWFDGQYPLLPANVAITVYLPVMSGDHAML